MPEDELLGPNAWEITEPLHRILREHQNVLNQLGPGGDEQIDLSAVIRSLQSLVRIEVGATCKRLQQIAAGNPTLSRRRALMELQLLSAATMAASERLAEAKLANPGSAIELNCDCMISDDNRIWPKGRPDLGRIPPGLAEVLASIGYYKAMATVRAEDGENTPVAEASADVKACTLGVRGFLTAHDHLYPERNIPVVTPRGMVEAHQLVAAAMLRRKASVELAVLVEHYNDVNRFFLTLIAFGYFEV